MPPTGQSPSQPGLLSKLVGKALMPAYYSIILPYLIGWLIAAPYYNWRYAQDHGFAAWFFFGEIWATMQASLWPYDLALHLF